MSDELFERIVEQLAEQPVEYVSPYLMADPLSDRKIFERIRRLREVLPDAHLEVSTTGLYLLPKLADRLLAAPISELRISSHGISAEEYAQTMPGVPFDKAMPNVMRFIERWQHLQPYRLSIVCLWGLWPAEREAEIEAFWTDLGVEMSKWRVVSRARHVDLTVFGQGSPDPTPYHRGRHEPPYLCRFHRDTEWMHILSDGRVTLCCMDYGQEVILGDASEDRLEEIWRGPAYAAVRARVRGEAPRVGSVTRPTGSVGRVTDPAFLCERCEWHVSESVHTRAQKGCEATPVPAGAPY